MSQVKGEDLRWTVCVTVRTKTGLLHDYTSYHTNADREAAEADALADVRGKIRPSARPAELVSWAVRSGYIPWPDPTMRKVEL
jgi:hypothetical protein